MLKNIFFLLIVLLLLIPTLGGSLVLWVYINSKFDKSQVSIILGEAEKSYKLGSKIIFLKNFNNISMKMIMKKLQASNTILVKDAALGLIKHSEIGEIYIVLMFDEKGIYIFTSNDERAAHSAILKMDLHLKSIEFNTLSNS
jgi:hypothetical protein